MTDAQTEISVISTTTTIAIRDMNIVAVANGKLQNWAGQGDSNICIAIVADGRRCGRVHGDNGEDEADSATHRPVSTRSCGRVRG